MVSTINIGIGLGVIALGLVLVFLVFRRFGVPALEDLGKATSGFGQGISDFFDSLGETETQKKTREAEDIFERQTQEKEQQSRDAGFTSVEKFERATDTTSIFNASIEELTKFNPPNIIGFGIPSLNQGRGIADTTENRQLLFDTIQSAGDRGISDVREVDFSGFGSTTTQEFGGFGAREISTIEKRESITPIIKRPRGRTKIQGRVRSELDTQQEFKVFSADSSRPVRGVIRETPKDPRRLRTDSRKRPTETASQRASRVFEQTGSFADEGRGFGVTKASRKASRFDFGTNTGRGLSISSNKSNRVRLAERKRIAQEKALAVFDSGSISNF